MAKQYYLVGSVYDRFAKGNKYKEEEFIKIPGVTFKSLVDIDKFTTQITSFDLLNVITEGYRSKNTISIKIFYSDSASYRKPVIFNNKELYELLKSVKQTKRRINGKYNSVFVIEAPNSYFNSNFNELMELLENDNVLKLESIFGNNKFFSSLVNKYLKRDKLGDSSSLVEELRNGFKDYEVFRTFIVNKNKSNTYTNYNLETTNISNIKKDIVIKGSKVGNFNLEKGKDEETIEYEKEDFFDDNEIEQMSGGEGNIPMYFTGRRL